MTPTRPGRTAISAPSTLSAAWSGRDGGSIELAPALLQPEQGEQEDPCSGSDQQADAGLADDDSGDRAGDDADGEDRAAGLGELASHGRPNGRDGAAVPEGHCAGLRSAPPPRFARSPSPGNPGED